MTKSPIRIAVLHFSHETVTFLRNDTTIDDFVYPGSPARGEALLASGPKSYMGGFVQVAREYDGVELVGIESPLWPKTGSGSGWVTQEAYETFVGRMIAQLTAEGPFDGVYLCVHGAMAARGIPRPEAELARRVREVVGPRAFIAATFDPHGNEDAGVPAPRRPGVLRQVLPALRQPPAGRARRAHAGACDPRHVPAGTCHGEGADHLADCGAMDRRLAMDGPGAARADLGGARAGRLCERVFRLPVVGRAGCRHDVPGDHQRRCGLARRIADDMAHFAWRRRDALLHPTKVHTIPEGVALAKQAVAVGETPVVLADHSDRSGYATWLLREIIVQGLSRHADRHDADAECDRRRSRMRSRAMHSTWRSADWPIHRRANRCASPAPCCT